jgi:SEC-C motif
MKMNRNSPCHCGSGKKYKKCHLAADESAEGQSNKLAALKVALDSGMDCNLDHRIDTELFWLLCEMSNALHVALSGQVIAGPSEDDAAVQNWVKYLGPLLWRAADAVVCLARHHESIAAMIVQRQAVEYFTRLAYYDRYPNIAELEWHRSIKQRIAMLEEDGQAGTPEHAAALAMREELRLKYPDFGKSGPTVQEMMEDLSGSKAPYVHHYRYASLLLHGNALGVSVLFATDAAGNKTMIEELELSDVHEILIDLTNYMVQGGDIINQRLCRDNLAVWQNGRARLDAIASRLAT